MARRKTITRKKMRKTKRPWRRRLIGALCLVTVAGAVWFLWPFWELAGRLAETPQLAASRLYGRSPVLELGRGDGVEPLIEELRRAGYRPAVAEGGLPVGRYLAGESGVTVHLRSFPSPSGMRPAEVLQVAFRGRQVAALRLAEQQVSRAMLEPPLIASFYGDLKEERRPVVLSDAPPELIQSVLAVEDAGFFHHPGLSITGILRAAWVNLRGGEVRQGGSTLTQQLAKNLFLTHERTWSRKVREVVLAVFLEARYEKPAILQTYLNEIYLGRRGSLNLIGVGAAARAYFGKEVGELELAEAATLAGMIRSPASHDPHQHPERALARRDQVLDRLAELEWVKPEHVERARQQPLGAVKGDLAARRAPYFASFAAQEAARRFGISDLERGGYVLLSTLSPRDQQQAEAAVTWGVEALEEGWQKGHKGEAPLQAALVSIDPRDGGIRAYVGGRDYAASQFDRVSQARRQAGSAFKPVVFAAAFEARQLSPASLVEDAPLTVRLAGRNWTPQNDDGEFAGLVSVRAAVEDSRNVPTVRVALRAGLPTIVDMARRLGVTAHLEALPSLALGAFEVSPLEMTKVYGTLAAGGLRPPVHSLRAVFDARGELVDGAPVPAPEAILRPQAAYLLTSVLRGVFDRGTATQARQDGLAGPLAGKTGTTNGRRDSWFAGYSADRTTVVWVGYDDNSSTRLSGARAALPIWSRFTQGVRPRGGFAVIDPPPGVVTAAIDPLSGELATADCPQMLDEVFLAGETPTQVCHLHRKWWQRRQRVERASDERGRWRRLLDRLRRDRDGGDP